MSKKTSMTGIERQLFHLIDENMEISEAINEFIDNAIDADASKIAIRYNASTKSFSIGNNGKPMSKEALLNYTSSFASNFAIKGKRKCDRIGFKGVGSKMAAIKLADHINGSMHVITSFFQDSDFAIQARFIIDDSKQKAYLDPEIIELRKNPEWTRMYGEEGTIHSVQNTKDFAKYDRNWMSNVAKKATISYSAIKDMRPELEITINGNNINIISDPLKHNLFEKNPRVNQVYELKDGDKRYFFYTKEYKLINTSKPKETKNVRAAFMYIPRDSYNDQIDNDFSGLFVMYKGKYINYPSSTNRGIKRTFNRGGACSVRAVLYADDLEELFAIPSNKSRGANISQTNLILQKYVINNAATGRIKNLSMEEAIVKEFTHMNKLYEYETKDTKKLNTSYHILTLPIAKKILLENANIAKLLKSISSSTPLLAPAEYTDADAQRDLEEISGPIDAPKRTFQDFINIKKNSEDGKESISFNESTPPMANKPLITKLFEVLNKENLPIKKIKRIINEFIEVTTPAVAE